MFAFVKAFVFASAGRRAEALAVLEPIEPAPEFEISRHYALITKFALSGQLDRFPEALAPEFVRLANLDACTAVCFAMAYATAGATDCALGWLEKTVSRGYFNYPYLRTHDRFMVSLHGNPRFERLMDQMKKTWEEFQA